MNSIPASAQVPALLLPEPCCNGVRVQPDATPDSERGDASSFGFLENEFAADGQEPGEFVSSESVANTFNAVGQDTAGDVGINIRGKLAGRAYCG